MGLAGLTPHFSHLIEKKLQNLKFFCLCSHLIETIRGLAGLAPENALLEQLIRFYNFCTHLIAHIPWPSGADASFASISFISHLTGLQRG